MNRFKKLGAILLVIALLITSVPLYAYADISNSKSATWQEGRKLVSSDGEYYTFKYQGFMQIWQYNTSGGDKFKGWTREFKDPRRIFSLTQGEDTVRGYCLEHGIIAEGGVKYSAESLGTNKVFNSLTEGQQRNIVLALLYGYGSKGSLKTMGFTSSSYAASGHEYNNDDWYMATQILVWEIEQGFRTASLDRVSSVSLHYGTGTSYDNVKAGDNVSIYHYYRVIKNTPAEDIYRWMLDSMQSHKKIPSKLSGTSDSPKVITLKQQTDSSGNPTNVWKGTVSSTDGKRLFVSYGKNSSKLDISYSKSSGKYVITWTGKDASDGPDSSVKYTIREYVAGRTTPDGIQDNLRVWVHKLSDTLHRQYILAGYMDEYKWYIKVKGVNQDIDYDEPEYFPEVRIPVSKVDSNPGWDGDNTTAMGDAELDAEYVLYSESGEEKGRVRLDETGDMKYMDFEPFNEEDLTVSRTSSVITWKASKTFTLKENAPEGRLIAPDTGERSFTVKYEASTVYDEKNGWSDIEYTVSCGDLKISGTEKDIKAALELKSEDFTFENDCMKGSLELEKLLEAGDDVTASKDSLWQIYLEQESADGKYIRYEKEEDLSDGTAVYRCVCDDSGVSCETESLKVGSNGKLKVNDIPYGRYYVEEVKADTEDYITECFTLNVAEDNETYSYSITDKKAKAKVTLIKADSETGKQVRLPGTKVNIRDKATGEYVVEEAELDKNGELELSEPLENGEYIIEEYELPEGYYAKDGNMSLYEFQVKESGSHMEGEAYDYGSITVKMDNSPVKGKINVLKTDENGNGLEGAVFGIYAAQDNMISDASGSLVLKNTADGSKVDSKLIKSTKKDERLEEIKDILGNTYESDVFDMGIYEPEDGARYWYMTERDTSADNRDMAIYTTPADEETVYSYSFEDFEVTAGLKNTGTKVISQVKVKGSAGMPQVTIDGNEISGNYSGDDISFDMESGEAGAYEFNISENVESGKVFEFEYDGFIFKQEGGMVIITPQSSDIEPEIQNGTGFEISGNTFTALKETIPYYFTAPDGENISLGYSGGMLHISIDADSSMKNLPEASVSMEKEGETDTAVLDLYSGEEIDLTERFPGTKAFCTERDGRYYIDIYTSYEVDVNLGSGYSLKFYEGNGMGIMESCGTYYTNGAVAGELVDVITTDENGKAESKLLALGKYIVRELKGIMGYTKETFGYELTLESEGQDKAVVTQDVTVVNESLYTEIDISKVFETKGGTGEYEPAAGATFGIFNEQGELLDEAEVNEEGKALCHIRLAEGIYYISETKTKENYELDTMKYYFEVKDSIGEYDNTFSLEDGISGEIFMDSNGTVKLVLSIENSIDMAEVYADGRLIKADEVKGDRSTYVLTCTDKMKVAFGEHVIDMDVESNTFTWSLDGNSETIVPEASAKVKSCYWKSEVKTGDEIKTGDMCIEIREDGAYIGDEKLESKDGISFGNGVLEIEALEAFEVSLNGIDVSDDIRTSESVTFERQSESASNIMVKINSGDGLNSGSILNDIRPGQIEITKEDMETGETLSGAEFEIYDDDNGKPGDVIFKGTTGDDGKLVLDEYDGTYWYHETKAPSGYVCDGEYYRVDIKDSKVSKVTMVNEREKGTLEITKEDMETGETLPGAEFEIYDDDNGKPGSVIFEGTTGDDGKLSLTDDCGVYWYHETKAPSGYVCDGEYYKVEIKYGEVTKVTMVNEREEGSLEITKEDMETGETLPGAEFEIYNDDNGKPSEAVFKGKTGDDGKLTITEDFGTYYYHETKAPAGYICDGEYYRVEIKAGEVTRVTMVNEKETEKALIVKTGFNYPIEYVITAFMAFILLAAALILRRRLK